MLKSFTQAAADYCAAAQNRTRQSVPRLLILGILAGMFIALAGTAASVGGALAGKIASAAIFPAGLAMVILAGSELFTGNCLFLLPLLRGDITGGRTMGSWAIVYCGNLIGSIVIAFVVVRCGVLDSIAPAAIATAAAKASLPFGAAFLRGVLCNLLVCLAVWMAFCAGSAGGKVVSLYGPIFLFVLCGFEHSIANMFYIGAGLFDKTVPVFAEAAAAAGVDMTNLTWGNFFLKNLLPVSLGNLVGGAFVGWVYWFCYLRKGKKQG